MRAIEAKSFSGYGGLQQTELPKLLPAKDKVLVHVKAAGVTPLDHTILFGGHPRAKPPLVLGNEGAGVIKDAGASDLAVGSRDPTASVRMARGRIGCWCDLNIWRSCRTRSTMSSRPAFRWPI
ncbi:MAG: alcohol dehydrogenase catalytic domain-containing protein [Roseiarcus sp.]